MNLREVKDTLYDITAMFFQGATILWAEQINTKPPLPYITLKTGALNRTVFPIEDDGGNRYYPSRITAEINLYTKGRQVTAGKDITGNYENTAVSDMTDFFNFVESDDVTDILAGKGMDVMLVQPVRDLTDLQNDSRYRYRSMAEMTVSFAMEADGPYGIREMKAAPNASGGGTQEMAEAEDRVIEEVELSEVTEGGNHGDEE